MSRKTLSSASPGPTLGSLDVWRRATGLLVIVIAATDAARAAGGHHAVDDAALLDPGQCQVEIWFDRDPGDDRALQHVGPTCRVGAVELGLNLDRLRMTAEGRTTAVGPQLKWALPLNATASVGAVLSATWQGRQGSAARFAGTTVVVPITWQAADSLLVHLNVGHDFRRGSADETRAGAALEWAPLNDWSFVAERFREGGFNFWRVGTRWVVSPVVNVDLGQARELAGSARPWWTLGMTWVFTR